MIIGIISLSMIRHLRKTGEPRLVDNITLNIAMNTLGIFVFVVFSPVSVIGKYVSFLQ